VKGAETTGFKTKSRRSTIAIMAKETGGSTIADTSRACSNEGSGENKYGDSTLHSESRVGIAQPICHGCGQGEKLL